MNYVIANTVQRGEHIREFQLRREDGAALPAWQPGAHLVLRFAAADGRRFEKHYSLIGKAGQAGQTDDADHYRIAVQREDEGSGGSRCLHEEYGSGGVLAVDGPFNSFPLETAQPADAQVVLVGGGIGITPLIPMAHALHAQGTPFTLHYLAATREDMALLDELDGLPPGAVTPHASRESGRADLAALLGAYRPGRSLYACGPVSLSQALAAVATAMGWPADALHFESFGTRAAQDDGVLTVELSLSGTTVEVRPGTSILDALIAADAFVSYECKRGECGNCYTRVVEGAPLHRDVCLTPAMRSEGMCTCVSWAAAPGRLVLEL